MRWIGGGSGAGKSTIARRLAAQYGLHVYATDDVMWDHAARSTQESAPQLSEFVAMSADDRWLSRSPKEMLDTFHWFRGEAFNLIVDDLLSAISTEPVVIVEGFRLLPCLVEPLLSRPSQAVWLLPTPRFRRAAFARRGTMWDIPNTTSDPQRAQQNLLERDEMFTGRLSREVKARKLPFVDVDNSMSEEWLTHTVATMLHL
ncbi:MAG TPA: AAA family ATPase [Pseudonocardia sp.]